jgi:hypothetical protein
MYDFLRADIIIKTKNGYKVKSSFPSTYSKFSLCTPLDQKSGLNFLLDAVKVKVKVKLSLCLNYAPRHEGVLEEWMYSSTHSLTSALDGGEWSASRPCCVTPRERTPGTNWTGDWVGPRVVLDAVKRKIPSPHRESNPRTPIVQPVLLGTVSSLLLVI